VRGITRIAADGGSAPAFRAMKHDDLSNAPVIADLAHFDAAPAPAERLLFNHRRVILVLCLLVTAVLAWGPRPAAQRGLREDDPDTHPYIANFLHTGQLAGWATPCASRWRPGTAHLRRRYLDTLRRSPTRCSCCPASTGPT
jgi:hypothetical protein